MQNSQSTLFDFITIDTKRGIERDGEFVYHPFLAEKVVQYREFQVELARIAVDSNLLVVLPTGLGKTLIAMLAAAEVLRKGGKKILFLAPTRPLVMQHLESFNRMFSLKSFALFTGSIPASDRRELWVSKRIIFSTPQSIDNDLKEKLYDLSDVSLCVFDEAHRAVGNYSYVEVAKQCTEMGVRILGLTASPGAKRDKIEDILAALNIDRVEIREREDIDVNSYIKDVKEDIVRVRLTDEMDKLLRPMDDLLHEKIVRLQRMGFLRYKKADMVSRKDLLSVRAAIMARKKRSGYLFGAMHNSIVAIHAYHCSELLETQGIEPLRLYLERLSNSEKPSRIEKGFLNDSRVKEVVGMLKTAGSLSHPKIVRLKEILEEQMARKPGSLIMVFTQYRDTIESIAPVLEERGIRFERFIGQADRGKNRGMTQKEQKKTIGDFAAGRFNVLLASSIGEEGIDVPDVDLVVFYEPIPSEIRYIQRKGRTGRSSVGRVVIMVAENTRDEAFLRASSKREKKMKRIVRSMKERERDAG
ncbi:MAG: DEAD/DEAH box helicase family protein [Candidatus Thermoplasmatota archaeon]|nr:DEAD/DEAH box helicase family protein [Candidatus Sysuiplasma jiujiangense]MBX8640112.1 DEAD/DEAH box helicase family protein [Candidatus Sysuiplasma jiujiangense]MBX8642480.1 DEAD/DEAH box helicase family protein [Candidatus Sysuiplasma jiujiangense]MCL5678267.1 DEAD/DEAH box helicase family protein [Candidatus Thermoplasmatota archaeon]